MRRFFISNVFTKTVHCFDDVIDTDEILVIGTLISTLIIGVCIGYYMGRIDLMISMLSL